MKKTNLIMKLLIAGVVVILLALDWAALHDIIKGEANPIFEYAIVALSLVIFGLLFFFWAKNRKQSSRTA